MALVLIFLGPLTTLLGAGQSGPDNAVYGLTRDYLLGFILGAPAFLCAQIMVPYMHLSDESSVIRIRDNCIHFDPTNYLKLHQSDDPAAHIGLRMVMGMVKQANYVNSVGLNNLTLVL